MLSEGSVFVSEIDQGTTALVLVGRGQMTFRPAPDREKSQVRIFSGAEAIDTRFDAAYRPNQSRRFRPFGVERDSWWRRRVEPDELRKAERIFREDSPKSYSLELGDLSRETWSLVPNARDFVAEIHTRRFDTLTYSRSSSSREDISLFQRNRRKTIALYPSQQNDRGETTDERRGRERRVRRAALRHRHLRDTGARVDRGPGPHECTRGSRGDSQPHAAAGGIAGRAIRRQRGVRPTVQPAGQRSDTASWSVCPTALVRGSELTLTVTYAGRLEPATIDTRVDRDRAIRRSAPAGRRQARSASRNRAICIRNQIQLVSAALDRPLCDGHAPHHGARQSGVRGQRRT